MARREPVPLLSLLTPPEGYRFQAGLWLTHDLAWTVLCDLVAPALADVAVTGPRRLLETRAAIPADAPGLVVLHVGGEHFTVGPALPWAVERAVSGRRLHAKAAVLQYRKAALARTKAIVMSANITHSGLATNHEVITWDEVGSGTGTSLAVDLLREFRRLLNRSPDQRARAVLRALAGRVTAATPTGALLSSLNREQSLLRSTSGKPRPLRRLVVVSPPFAGNADAKAAGLLAPWCGPATAVDLYTAFDGTSDEATSASASLVLSSGLVSGLRKVAGSVKVHAVPADPDGFGPRRLLHAKAVAFVHETGKAEFFAGSANCTGPGLTGGNRELMVRQRLSESALDGFLSELGAVEWSGGLAAPPTKTPATNVPDRPDIRVRLVVDPTADPEGLRWVGILHVDPVDAAVRLRYLGKLVHVGEAIEFDSRYGAIDVTVGGKTFPVQVRPEPPPGDPGFWGRITPESREDRPDPWLRRLFGDLRQAAQAGPDPTPPGGKAKSRAHPTAEFSVPLEQRLVLLARYRRHLSGRSQTAVAEIASYLESEGEAARQVVSSLLAAYIPAVKSPADPLLARLAEALPAFDSHFGDSDAS